jgi:pyruvate kinase
MHRIAIETETHLEQSGAPIGADFPLVNGGIDDPVIHAACSLAAEVEATAIIIPTLSGRTARLIARHRPWAKIVGVAPTDKVLQMLTLVWGVLPVRMTPTAPGGDRMAMAVKDAFAAGTVAVGERVIVLAQHPVETGPLCPTLRVVRVGEGGNSVEP